jgi:glycosyltransferase involved in cell wall biosynthesis
LEKKDRKMRIGFDGRWYGHSGVGNYVSELLKAMGALDEDLEIIVYEDPKNPLEAVNATSIRKVAVYSGRYSVREQFELARRIGADRLDVFHSPFYITPLFASCPVVVTIHDLIPFLFKIYKSTKQQIIKLGYRAAVLKASRLIADSANTGDDLRRILRVPGDRIRVVHLATSPDYFHSRQDVNEVEYLLMRYGIRQPYVLTLSATNWRTKNLSVVLQAISECQRQTRSRFQTVVVGPPDGFREVLHRKDVQTENVVVTGFVSTADLAKLYRGADVFLLASKYEGFGLPLLEAMSCGCAVICSNGGALAEVAGGGAVLVDPGDPIRIGQVLARLLSDPGERQRQKLRAAKRSVDFSWREAARKTVSVYSEVAKCRV